MRPVMPRYDIRELSDEQFAFTTEGPVVRMAHVEWHVHNHHPTATAYRIRVGTGDWTERNLT